MLIRKVFLLFAFTSVSCFATVDAQPVDSLNTTFQIGETLQYNISYGFLDVGTAWTGKSPYADDNSFNTEVISGNPVTVTLDRQVDPVVAGFGGGIRSRLFGYFIRSDWGWGYEDGVVRDPIFYLSLGLDF